MHQRPDDLRVVVFGLSGHEHAVDVRLVCEILTDPLISPVAEAPGFVEGVIKLRGRIVPVVDLRKRLRLPVGQHGTESCVMIMRIRDNMVGFAVDSAHELVTIPADVIEEPTELLGGVGKTFMYGVAYLGPRFLVILDPDRLLSDEESECLDRKGLPEEDRSAEPDGIEPGAGARVGVRQRKIVAFELSDELYGADIEDVAEIMEMTPIRKLPNVPDFILGLVNLRGTIMPVVDLGIRFGLGRRSWDDDTRIIVVRAGSLLAGMVVDRMWELLRLPIEAFQLPPPDVAKLDAEYFKDVSEVHGRMLVVLDMQKILRARY